MLKGKVKQMGMFKPGKILTMEDKQDELLGEFCCHAIYKPFDRITNAQNFSRLDHRSRAKLVMFHEELSRLLGVKVVEDERV
jgi:hypothetical protein